MLTPTQIKQTDYELWKTLARIPALEGYIGSSPITNGRHHEVHHLSYHNHVDYIIQSKRKDGKKKSTSKVKNSIIQANVGIAPPCIFYDDNVAVYEFVDGEHPEVTDDNIVRIANIIKSIQNGPKMQGKYCPIKKLNNMRSKIKKSSYISKLLDQIINQLQYNTSLVPSHNDLGLQNIIDTGERMYVIDWEFSGQAVKEWDPAFLSVHGHFNADQDKLLLESLYGNVEYDEWVKHKFYKLIFIGMLISMKVRSKNEKSLKAWSAQFDKVLIGKY